MNKNKFNFKLKPKENYINIFLKDQKQIPIYSQRTGYGFTNRTSGIYNREVSTERIIVTPDGCFVNENESSITWSNGNHYNYGGMVFRIDVESLGAYKVEVTVASKRENTWVSVSEMQADKLMALSPWDAAELLPKENYAKWENNTWSYEYVTGCNYIEIEVEPLLPTDRKPTGYIDEIGIAEIVLTKLENKKLEEKRTIFTLGDSTVKSYIFEEAGMSGWGQVFDDFFDLEQVDVVNYSQGGRSFKTMYCEGRLNEVLMKGKIGDYLLLQSGHNDEATGPEKGPEARFGRGATAGTYAEWIEKVIIPSVHSRGMIPILVTPMTRIDSSKTTESRIVWSGFKHSDYPGIDYPGIMKHTAKELEVAVLNLYEESTNYINEIGGSAAVAMFLSIEAGELPSKTNSGSYANGNPSGCSDGAHFKETLSKQWARILVSELWKKEIEIAAYLKPEVKTAISTENWEKIFPEIAKDIQTGENAYYRNQIEKMLQLGVLKKDEEGLFHPKDNIDTLEFIKALNSLWNIGINHDLHYKAGCLTREIMGAILYDAYLIKFGMDSIGKYVKPKYLTDYNGTNLSPEDPNYDSNLVGESAMYYPLTPWDRIIDLSMIQASYIHKVKEAYQLGLLRCEKGIERGKMINGIELEPQKVVTKEKAAKALYFMWVLARNIKEENDK